MNNFEIPRGYICSVDDIRKIGEEESRHVCYGNIRVYSVFFNPEEMAYKIVLSYKRSRGEWVNCPPQNVDILFADDRFIKLADYGFPITSDNKVNIRNFILDMLCEELTAR